MEGIMISIVYGCILYIYSKRTGIIHKLLTIRTLNQSQS